MIVTTKGRKALLFGGVAASSLLLAACGGSGDGGTTSSINYTGVTTAAAIDETTAPVLADAAISSASIDATGGSTGFVGVQVVASGPSPVEQLKGLIDTVKRFSGDITPGADSLAGARVSDSVTWEGCTGSLTISATVDDFYVDASGESIVYSETMSFNNFSVAADPDYCDSEVIDGSLSATPIYDGPVDSAPQMNGFTITINDYSTTDTATGQSQAFSGTMAETTNITTGESTLTMTVNFRDIDGQVYRMENYTIKFGIDGDVSSISGRLYDPAYGYIELSTPTQFDYSGGCYDSDFNRVPSSGVLRIGGANGGYIEIDAAGDHCTTYTLTWSADGTNPVPTIEYW